MPELQSYKYIPYFPWFRIFIYRKAQISAPNFQRRDAWTLQLCLTSLLLALHHNFILKWLSCGSKTESQGREREFPLLPGIEGSRLPSRPLLYGFPQNCILFGNSWLKTTDKPEELLFVHSEVVLKSPLVFCQYLLHYLVKCYTFISSLDQR